jgi:hypothetical protein
VFIIRKQYAYSAVKIEIFNIIQMNLDPQRNDNATYSNMPNITIERAELFTFGSLGFKSGPRIGHYDWGPGD